jgi:hypothetical protein
LERARSRLRASSLAAIAEALTGLALLIVPSLVGRLLLGEALSGVAVPLARVTGIDPSRPALLATARR